MSAFLDVLQSPSASPVGGHYRLYATLLGLRVRVCPGLVDWLSSRLIVHSHHTWSEGQNYAGIDIFRLDSPGLIVEHWNVLQVVPDTFANASGKF